MRLTLSKIENDEAEKADAKKYWAEQKQQKLVYDLKSHYAGAIAEVLKFIDAKSVFEFGCAAGRNLKALQETFAEELDRELLVDGIDVNENAINLGREQNGLDIKLADENYLGGLEEGTFDLVFTVSVLDHVPNPEKFIHELMNISTKYGVFIEPWIDSEYGKVNNIDSRWYKKANCGIVPYTYFHDYPSIFSSAGLNTVFKIPLPTHLNLSGPTYQLWLVSKGDDVDISSFELLSDKIIAYSILQLLENVKVLQGRMIEDEKIQNKKLQAEKRLQIKKEKSLQAQLKATKKQLANVKDSVGFRIGAMFIKDIRRPLHWALMPIKLFRIYRVHKKRKNVEIKKKYNFLDELTVKQNIPLVPLAGRVCYTLHNSLPYASGGYATRSHGVAMGLAAQGLDIQVVTRSGYPLDVKDVDFTSAENTIIDGIPYHRILEPGVKGEKLENYMRLSIEAYMETFRLLRPAYVVSASSFRHSLPVIIAAKRLSIPTIYEVRGFWEVTRISRDPGFAATSDYEYQRKMEAETAIAADSVITLTGAMKQELVDRGVPEAKISLVPNACNPEKFFPVERNSQLGETLGIPSGVPVIGYIGSWVHYEGLEDLVRACSLLYERGVEFRCLIVGSENVATNTHGPIFESIKEIISGTDYEDWVITPGRVPFEKVQDYYSLIDIAPFPRKPLPVTEIVSPMKPLEAMAMEKAVLVSSVGALNEMVNDKVTGLVFEKGNVDDLADKLDILIKDEKLRQKLGSNGRRFVLEERNWNTVTNSFLNELSALNKLKFNAVSSKIRKSAIVDEQPPWWHLLPDDFARRCRYISIKDWAISDKTKELVKRYDEKFGKTIVSKRIPALNWKRADACWRLVPENMPILDIGSGLGEFVNLVAMHNPQVDITSVDTKDYDLWLDSTGRIKRVYENIFNLGNDHKKDIVTCFEVIEHLPPERLEEAVAILRSLARRKLFVSVPFMEAPPLYRGHFTRFTAENILELFPDATFTVFGKSDTSSEMVSAWILCEVEL